MPEVNLVTVLDDVKGTKLVAADRIFYAIHKGTKLTVAYDNGKKLNADQRVDEIATDTAETYASATAFAGEAYKLIALTGAGDLDGYTVAVNLDFIASVETNGTGSDIYLNNFSAKPNKFNVTATPSEVETAMETARDAYVTEAP